MTKITREQIEEEYWFNGCVNQERANLEGIDLSDFDFWGEHLFDSGLAFDDERKLNFSRANLRGASLSGANLSRSLLDGANLVGANLAGAKLYGANLARR